MLKTNAIEGWKFARSEWSRMATAVAFGGGEMPDAPEFPGEP